MNFYHTKHQIQTKLILTLFFSSFHYYKKDKENHLLFVISDGCPLKDIKTFSISNTVVSTFGLQHVLHYHWLSFLLLYSIMHRCVSVFVLNNNTNVPILHITEVGWKLTTQITILNFSYFVCASIYMIVFVEFCIKF